MKNENEFNAALGREFRKLPSIHTYKPCDRFTPGVPDFFIYGYGHCLGLECKFIKDWPKKGLLLKKHPFTGPQLTFMESLVLAGQDVYGIVAVEKEKQMFVIPFSGIPTTGNWDVGYFQECEYFHYPWLDVRKVVDSLLKNAYG